MSDLPEKLASLLGPKGWLQGGQMQGFSRDWLNRAGVPPLGVARPASTAEVVHVVTACGAAGVAIVPQGGNTGLCAASVADRPGSVIVSLGRMDGMDAPDAAGGSILVEAGAVLARLHSALDGTGLIFPLHLGAEGSAQIGGLIGTNAGGSHAFRYGMMGDLVLGLEAVLPDGSVWNGLRAVQKDNAGYQLRKLFCGAEGTLGIVTRAVLKLFPAPRRRETALLGFGTVANAVTFGTRLRAEAGEFLSGLEFFSRVGLELALKHVQGMHYPLEAPAACTVLVELTSGSERVPLGEILESLLEWGMEAGLVLDGTLAQSEAQRNAFWRLREEQPEGQRLEGRQLKHDIAVPPGAMADFVERGATLCETILPGVRINPFGHLADGNIHYNLSPPLGTSSFDGRDDELGLTLARLATGMGGSFAAEHGLGRSKIALADALRPDSERRMMAGIKAALDPQELLNPGVVVAAPVPALLPRNDRN